MKTADMIEFDPPERKRTYRFPGGGQITLKAVTHLFVSDSGTHRVRTADGRLHIVASGWLHIEVDAADWTV
jgi:hypothetical protein